jgi:serine/threonine-protein kinase Stk1
MKILKGVAVPKQLAERMYDQIRQEALDCACLSFKSVMHHDPLRIQEIYSIPFLYTQAGCARYINERFWEILADLARGSTPATKEACVLHDGLRIRRELLALYFRDYIEVWSLLGRVFETGIPLPTPLSPLADDEDVCPREAVLPPYTGEEVSDEPVQSNNLSANTEQNLPIQVESDRFHLEALLGAGGMCEVYAARDLRRVEWGDSTPRVAVKRLLPELRDNRQAQIALAQEFFVLRHLVHPGVIRVFDLHQQSWGSCYSMELLDGVALHACDPVVLAKNAFAIAVQLFDLLDFLHTRGIVHGDIKPANLFLAADGRLTLIDFNIAVAHSKHGAATSPVGKGIGAGMRLAGYSALHASPDCLRGNIPHQPDDIFSACCTVYEVIAGKHPFNRRPSLEAEAENLHPVKPEELSGKAWKLLAAGLVFDGAKRPDAGELRQAFSGGKSSLFGLFFSSAT